MRRFTPIVLNYAIATVLLATAPAFEQAVHGAETAERPNIVFIYADDLGFGDLACHGHPHVITPRLDQLAREGTDFWSFTVVNPVCSPSRTGIVTGNFPSRWGVHQHFASHEQNVERNMPDWLDPKATLLPRLLQEAGYNTAHYGKWHLSGGGVPDAPLPAEYGYDDAAVFTGPGRHVFDGLDYKFGGKGDDSDASAHDKEAASWISVAATDHAVKFIRDHRAEPFYINLWLHETHHLVSATEDDKKPYPDLAEPQRTYCAAVTRADRQVGRILDVLDELSLSQNTIVIFSSDNGPENSHPNPGQKLYFSVGDTGGLRGRKRSLLMGGVNVPFIVRWPGRVPAGRVDKETAFAGVDVLPTLLAATGVSAPAGYTSDGENMLAAMRGEPQSRTKPVFWWWQGGHSGDDWPAFAMREGPWTLILDETKERAELCNVVDDRGQQHNVADEHPDQVARMRASIEEWFATLSKEVDPSVRSTAVKSPKAAPAKDGPDRARAFERWDTNHDNVLTLDEYSSGLSNNENADTRFQNFDKNSDGQLSREEFVGPAPK